MVAVYLSLSLFYSERVDEPEDIYGFRGLSYSSLPINPDVSYNRITFKFRSFSSEAALLYVGGSVNVSNVIFHYPT